MNRAPLTVIRKLRNVYIFLKVRQIIRRADRVIHANPPNSEADFRKYRLSLVQAESELRGVLGLSENNYEVLRRLAILEDRRGHWKDALAWWSRLEELASNRLDEASLALANTYSLARMPHRAKRHLDRVSKQCRKTTEYKVLSEAAAESIEIVESLDHADKVLESAALRAPLEDAEGNIEVVLRKSRMPFSKDRAIRDLLVRAYDIGMRMPEATAAPRSRDRLDSYRTYKVASEVDDGRPRFVFTCGFLWSGSGAVTDMLKDVEGFGLAASGNELRLFKDLKQPGSLLSIFDSPASALGAKQVVGLILGPVLGLHSVRKEIELNRDRSLAKALCDGGGDLDGLLGTCNVLLDRLEDALAAGEQVQESMMQALRWFAPESLACLGAGKDQTLILNNSIFGFRIRMLALFKNAVAITVKRDPRDQYVSEYYERAKHRVTPIDAFIQTVRARREDHDRAITELGLTDRVVEVLFEDFVQNEETRRSILTKVGFDPEIQVSALAFNPDRSGKNIGIHRNFPDQGVIRRIEDAFPDFIR